MGQILPCVETSVVNACTSGPEHHCFAGIAPKRYYAQTDRGTTGAKPYILNIAAQL